MAEPVSLNSEIDTLNDIKSVAESSFQQCKDMIKDILIYSSDSRDDLQLLKEHMENIIVSQKELSSLIHATNQVCNLTSKVNLTESEVTTKFMEVVEECINEGENYIEDTQEDVLFSIDNFINDNQISDQGEDADLLVTKTSLSYKDTLTQRTIQDPVKSKVCSHLYEKETIMAYLANKNKKCPFSGCQSTLSRNDLVEDFVLKTRLSIMAESSQTSHLNN